MSYDTHQTGTELSYLAVLLLLAYVMSSAPRYLREFRQNHQEIKIEKASPIQQVIKIGKYYTIDPYIRAWNHMNPAPSTNNLATIPASIN
jgi:hypothetical protein